MADKPVQLGPWPDGVNNILSETDLTGSQLRAASNIDLPSVGKPRRRKGYAKVISTTFAHSLWDHEPLFPYNLYVDNGTLKAFDVAYNITTVLAGLSVNEPLSYAYANGKVFWSNDVHTGIVTDKLAARPWGVPSPDGQPTLSTISTGGGLPAGKYQVAITYVDNNTEESGSTLAAEIVVPDDGGIQLTHIPQPADASVQFIRVYVTTHNGDQLYWHSSLPVGITSYALGVTQLGTLCDSQFLVPMPACTLLHHYNGRIYGAHHNLMWFTESLRYGLTHRHRGFRRYPSDVTMIHRAKTGPDSGLYVGTKDKVYIHNGGDPANFESTSRSEAYDAGVVPGSCISVPGGSLGIDAPKDAVPVWLSTDGIFCAGLPDGVKQLTKDKLSLPEFAVGTGVYREIPNIKQMVFGLRGAGPASNLAASTEVSVSITRNGIVLP